MARIQRLWCVILVVVSPVGIHSRRVPHDDGWDACKESDHDESDGVALMQFRNEALVVRADDESSDVDAQFEDKEEAATMLASAIVGPNLQWCTVHSVHADCVIDWSRIQVLQVPMPRLFPGTVLVRVVASSVNPAEWKGPLLGNYVDSNFTMHPISYPYVTGVDFSGVIEKIEGPCTNFSVGDEVWGLANHVHAEYIETPCNYIAKKPNALSFLQAGALGTAAMTSLEALANTGVPWPASTTVLIIGGSSGTGHYAIQLARSFGASKIITTCSPDNKDFVMSLGADEVINYHTSNWWEVIPAFSVHVVYDCISLSMSGNHAYTVLADGGYYVGLLPTAAADKSYQISRPSISHKIFFLSWFSTPYLERLNAIIDAGNLTAHLDHVFQGLAQVPQLFNTSLQGHTVGKLALQIST